MESSLSHYDKNMFTHSRYNKIKLLTFVRFFLWYKGKVSLLQLLRKRERSADIKEESPRRLTWAVPPPPPPRSSRQIITSFGSKNSLLFLPWLFLSVAFFLPLFLPGLFALFLLFTAASPKTFSLRMDGSPEGPAWGKNRKRG